jgi:predicted amidohydrolase
MVEGVSYQISGLKIKVFSEFYADNQRAVAKLSELWNDNLILCGYATDKIYMAMALNGKVLDKRAKVMLTKEDRKHYKAGDISEIRTFNIDGFKIIPVICYEIVFSAMWRRIPKADLIVHLIGDAMYNEHQKLKWSGLQEYMVRHFKCPLVCAVGGKTTERIKKLGLDISGVVKYENETNQLKGTQ